MYMIFLHFCFSHVDLRYNLLQTTSMKRAMHPYSASFVVTYSSERKPVHTELWKSG